MQRDTFWSGLRLPARTVRKALRRRYAGWAREPHWREQSSDFFLASGAWAPYDVHETRLDPRFKEHDG